MYTFSGKCFRDENLTVPDYVRYHTNGAFLFAKQIANEYGVTCDIRYAGQLLYKVRTGDNPMQIKKGKKWIVI
jgi:hypothetical protein